MGINFEFDVSKYPRILKNSKWTKFQYKHWPEVRETSPCKEFVKQVHPSKAAMAFLDTGSLNRH